MNWQMDFSSFYFGCASSRQASRSCDRGTTS